MASGLSSAMNGVNILAILAATLQIPIVDATIVTEKIYEFAK